MPPVKSFRDNPALKFISGAQDPIAPQQEETRTHAHVHAQVYEHVHVHTHTQQEKRTARFACVLPPSLKEKAMIKAQSEGISLNELIIRSISSMLEQER